MIKIIVCSVFILLVSAVHAQTEVVAEKSNKQPWYKKYECLKTLPVPPDESTNKAEFAKQYSKSRKWWDEAFAYFKNTNLESLAPGDHPIDGKDVFIRVTEAVSKDIDSARWESHQRYHDIHYIVSGKEMIGITPANRLQPSTTYDKNRDIIFFNAGWGRYFLADTERFFIIFANQAHRPTIKLGGYDQKVKRVVIKVRNLEAQD